MDIFLRNLDNELMIRCRNRRIKKEFCMGRVYIYIVRYVFPVYISVAITKTGSFFFFGLYRLMIRFEIFPIKAIAYRSILYFHSPIIMLFFFFQMFPHEKKN